MKKIIKELGLNNMNKEELVDDLITSIILFGTLILINFI